MNKPRVDSIPSPVWVVLLVFACLFPFINKAFHIDDPLFLWMAEHIRVSPLDFYNFNVNWFGLEMPMTDATCNPPLMAFFLAAGSLVFGWSEVGLHFAGTIPAIAAALGTFQLAKRFCERPLLAAALAVLTPGFLVCSTSLMCDTLMLAFWVWAVVFWERGLADRRQSAFLWAGLLAGLAVLTKYSGLCLVPLFLASALLRRTQTDRGLSSPQRHPSGADAQRPGNASAASKPPADFPVRLPAAAALALLIPIAMLVAYEWFTYRVYGVVMFQNAMAYAREVRPNSIADLPSRLINGLVFTGGCAVPALLLAPWLWSRRVLGIGTGLFLSVLIVPPLFDSLGLGGVSGALGPAALFQNAWHSFAGKWPLEAQRAVWLLGGVSISAIAVLDYRRNRDAAAALLGLWLLGVLIFASACNWTLNGRSILPMLPAMGILLVRRLHHRGPPLSRCSLSPCLPILPAAFIAIAVTTADYQLANSGRAAATMLSAKYPAPANKLLFQGHWGFQYYLEKKGLKPLNVWKGEAGPDDLIVTPSNDIHELPIEGARLLEVFKFLPNRCLSTLDRFIGAGFHTDFWGPLPFAVGHVEPERYYVFKIVQPVKFVSDTALLQPIGDTHAREQLARCQATLRSNPDDAEARFQAALLFLRESQFAQASTNLLEVLRIKPNDIQAHAQLAQLYQAAGKSPEAKEHYYAALAVMPDFLSVLNNLAWLMATDPDPLVRDGRKAVRLASRATAITLRKRPIFLGTLAAAYAEAGRYSDAVAASRYAAKFAANIGQSELAEKNRDLLQFYRAGKPYRAGQTTDH